MTVDQPLSAGRTMEELSSPTECRALFCSVGKFFFGSFAFCRIKLVFALTFSTSSLSGRVLMVVSTLVSILVDNIYVRFGGQLFQQMVGIPMGRNCAPLLVDLFLYSYENEFLDKLIKENKRKLARKFNVSYCYIDNLISFNNKRFKGVHF